MQRNIKFTFMSINTKSLFRILFGCIPSPQVIPAMADSASFIKFSFAFIKISIICFDHRENDPKSLYRQILNTSLLSLPTDKVAFKFLFNRKVLSKYRYLAFYVFLSEYIVCACVLSSCH
jgi:hypothetical protein